MIIAKRLKGKAISAWLGSPGDAVRKAVAEVKARLPGATPAHPRQLAFYFDIADPWSYVAGQAVARLVDAHGLELAFTVVTPPASDVDAAPELRTRYAMRDTQQLAEYWDLEFPGKKDADPGMARDIGTVLIRERPAREQLTAALELTAAMWTGDRKAVQLLVGKWGADSHGSVAPILNSAYAGLRKAGHYQGAMIQYGGTWYWGIDRLPHLEAELARERGTSGAEAITSVITRRPEAERGPLALSDKPLTCEMWYSFRSPYSYLALEQIEQVLAPYGIPLVLKPIAPMVARGLPLPNVKRLYIVRDAKREADRLGIAFGDLCDPLGKGIEHCLALAHWAHQRGAGLAFARSVMRGIWSEARDVAEYVDLRELVERAGLPWDEAVASLEDPAAGRWAHESAAELNGAGLWGVPAFRIGGLVMWGQDRLPLLADRLRRHALAAAEAPAEASAEAPAAP